ncbi:hypothetical protein, partial [Actinoplanes philippinensis]|uniref:hypothetical protein n=1 Tax=Actinoplanes philippinensis TaxID=35752 RepID=UPI0033C6E8AA
TLQSAAPAAGAPSAPGTAGQRPVFPVDATEAQLAAMIRPWEDCMVAKGGTKFRGQGAFMITKGLTAADAEDEDVAAFRACEAKQPESFDDHQKRTNPTEYKDNQREWYKCAEAAGYQLTEPDPETGEFGLTAVGPNGDAGSDKFLACKRKAFAG